MKIIYGLRELEIRNGRQHWTGKAMAWLQRYGNIVLHGKRALFYFLEANERKTL